MKILLIRHAEAVEANEWHGDDMSRPLTKKGLSQTKALARFLKKSGLPLDAIISSEAVRARETAGPVAQSARKKMRVSSLLNPGCTVKDVWQLVHDGGDDLTIAMVGHEPDLSTVITRFCGSPKFRLKLGKAASALIEVNPDNTAELRWLIPALPSIGKKRRG